MNQRTLIVSSDPELRSQLRAQILSVSTGPAEIYEADSASQALPLMTQLRPSVALVDLAEGAASTLRGLGATVEERRLPTALVGLLAASAEAGETLQAMRAGARDLLLLPIEARELRGTLERHRGREEDAVAPASPEAGGVVVVFAPKGGVGTTSLAVNLALAIASRDSADTCLIDADLHFGNAASFLDLASDGAAEIPSLATCARERGRLDAASLRAACLEVGGGDAPRLAVLAAPADPLGATLVDEDALASILMLCHGAFRFTVVDAGSTLDANSLALFDAAARLVVLTEATLPSLEATSRFLKVAAELRCEDRIVLGLNRYDASAQGGVDREQVESALGRPVDFVLPEDREVVVAANRGTPLVVDTPGNGWARGVADLAADFQGQVRAPRPVASSQSPVQWMLGLLAAVLR